MPTRDAPRRANAALSALRHELRRAAAAYLALALCLILTAGATVYIAQQVAIAEQARLDRDVDATEIAVANRLARYLDALQGARGLFAASDAVDRQEWAAYVRTLDLQNRYPGTRSIAYARWVPAADEAAFLAEMRAGGIPEYAIPGAGGAAAYAPLTYVEPMTEAARRALGFDALTDPARRAAIERARDTGQPAATESTVIVTDRGAGEQRSVLLYVPVYRGGGVPGTVAERRAALHGFVLTGWRMDELMAGVFGALPTTAPAFAISDDPAPRADRLLYASDGAGAATTAAALDRPARLRTLDVAGRTWTLSLAARPARGWIVSAFVAGAGITLSLLIGLATRVQVLGRARAERRYRDLFAHAGDIVYEYDFAGRCIAANPTAERLLGYTAAELRALPLMAVVAPADHRRVRAGLRALRRRADDGGAVSWELTLLAKDGTQHPVEVSAHPTRDGAQPTGVQGIARDITGRKMVEAGQREAAENFDSLFGASEAIAITEGGCVVAINPAYTALLGWEPEDIVGRMGTELVVPEDRATAATHLAVGDERPYAIALWHKDGTTVATEIVGRAIRYQGRPARLATLRDMTARVRAESALRASEKRFRSAFEHAAIGKALVGLDGRWLRVNLALCALLDYTPDELLATNFQNLTHPDDLSTDLGQVHRLLAGASESYQIEKRYHHKGGQWVWALLSVSLVRNEAEAPLHFISEIQDISARKRAEEGLALLHAIAATANEAATLADAARPVLDRICAHTGWPVGHLLIGAGDGTLVSTELWHPDDPTSFPALRAASAQARFAPGEGLPGRTLVSRAPVWIADVTADDGFVRGRSGGLGIKAAFAFPILVGSEVIAIFEFFSPVAAAPDAALLVIMAQVGTQIGRVVERERAGEALRRSEVRHRAVVDTAFDAIVTASADGLIRSFNVGAERIFGHDSREVCGEPLAILMPERFRAGHSAGLARVGATGEGRILGQTLELVGQRRDGTEFPLELTLAQGRDDQGVFFTGIMRDISARVAAEASLAASHQALEAKTREQDSFLYTVSHDLRAPLLSMQGMANILLEEYASRLDDGRLYLDRIVANAEKMQALLDELLEISRVGRVDVELVPVPLDAVVADVREQLHHALTTRGARVEIGGPLPTVRANRMRMVQLFANLIANAVHYTPQGRDPLVRIGAAPHADGWEITIADNGVGIPAAYRDKVLGLFQRLPAGKALNPGGTGAGLAIVARIVDTHGGSLWFDSPAGAGTTFHLTLPAAPAAQEPSGPPANAAPCSEMARVPSRREGLPA